jgi:hypothetical protein
MTRPDDDREVPEPTEEDLGPPDPDMLPLEAEPADVVEQAQAIPTGDDEYRSE